MHGERPAQDSDDFEDPSELRILGTVETAAGQVTCDPDTAETE